MKQRDLIKLRLTMHAELMQEWLKTDSEAMEIVCYGKMAETIHRLSERPDTQLALMRLGWSNAELAMMLHAEHCATYKAAKQYVLQCGRDKWDAMCAEQDSLQEQQQAERKARRGGN